MSDIMNRILFAAAFLFLTFSPMAYLAISITQDAIETKDTYLHVLAGICWFVVFVSFSMVILSIIGVYP